MSNNTGPRAGVHAGDHVFFNHAKGPSSGKVLAHGVHGCTIEHEGKKHKVKWEHVLGHKSRKEQSFKIVDHGDDGMVITDASGKRRYVGVQKPKVPSEIDVE